MMKVYLYLVIFAVFAVLSGVAADHNQAWSAIALAVVGAVMIICAAAHERPEEFDLDQNYVTVPCGLEFPEHPAQGEMFFCTADTQMYISVDHAWLKVFS